MTPAQSRRALLLTNGRARGSLAAVRALHAAGWTVGVGTPDGSGMVAASRWCAQRHTVARPRGDGEQFLEEAQQAVKECGYHVVFGGGDDWVVALDRLRDLTPARVAHPLAATVAAATDKLGLVRRAAAAGLAAPTTAVATHEAMSGWEGPVVVKCRFHWHAGHQLPYRIEATYHPNVPSALDQVDRIRKAGLEPLLQAPVDGRLSALVGLYHEGRLLGRLQQVSPRLWPTPMGVSSRAQTTLVDEDLASRACALLAGLAWSGLVELQFLTPPGGAPHLIDFNGRFYGSMDLALAAGVNLPDAWGRQVLGHPLPALDDARPGVRFQWIIGDVRRALVERRGGLLADLASTLGWSRGAAVSVWDLRDMGPVLHLTAARLRQAIHVPAA